MIALALSKIRGMSDRKYSHIQGLQRSLLHHLVASDDFRAAVLRWYSEGRVLIEVP